MTPLPITRVVLYKHGVGYFERQGRVEGDAVLSLTFKQAEVSDVLKSLTALDLDGGHFASVSYDSTKPLEQLLAEIALSVPDKNSLAGLLPQIKGARVAVVPPGGGRAEGVLLGVDSRERRSADGVVRQLLLSLLGDDGGVRQFDLADLSRLEILDPALRRDLDYVLRTQLSAKKKDARTFTLFARGEGARAVRLSYTLEAPVWKATYRVLLDGEGPPLIQGWAVVDNTQDEDWDGVELSLVAGLPVSFVHDLYTPRYIRRPVVAVAETTGVLPPEVEEGFDLMLCDAEAGASAPAPAAARRMMAKGGGPGAGRGEQKRQAASSTPVQVRERKLGDLFEYAIEHPVTIRRNQSALVPIVLRPFEGRSVLLHNRDTRPNNPMRAVDLKNTTGLTLEGGPVTVLEGGGYVGEAMLDTTGPNEKKLLPYAVELSVSVLDNVESHAEDVHRVVVRDGRLTRHSRVVRQTTYHFDSKGDAEQVVYLDHPRENAAYRLHDTADPVETTENYWRFRFALPAKAVTRFVVRQQQPTAQVQMLAGWDATALGLWLEQKHVDERTAGVLRQVADAQRRAAELEARMNRLREERDRLVAGQARARENLGALGERASEVELRERYVRALAAAEDRIEAVAAEFAEAEAGRDAARGEVGRLLGGLEYEGAVAG